MNDLSIWNRLSRPPKEALKKITGGRLSGMTDINPQWRIKIMTEAFGAIGFGWKYRVVNRWKEEYEGQVACFVSIELFVKEGNAWSEPIEGIGGSMLVTKERNGMYFSDEAYKMALTDALSVAMKQLGVAADIYAGLWDGSKYRDVSKETNENPKAVTPPKNVPNKDEVEKTVEEVCSDYMETAQVPEGFYVAPPIFKEQIRKLYTKLPAKDKKDFVWDKEHIEALIIHMDVKDVIKEVPK